MNGQQPARGLENPDGSVDVWIDSRQLHFPADRGKPTVSKARPPDGAGALPSTVKLVSGPVSQVRSGDWIVIVGKDTARIRLAIPRRIPVTRILYRLFDRDAEGH
jgi:hypothetical protein